MVGADFPADNPWRWGSASFKILKALLTHEYRAGTASGQHHHFLWAESSKLYGSLERRWKENQRPGYLSVRQMEQWQEWEDLSRRSRLEGMKCRPSAAGVMGRVVRFGIIGNSVLPPENPQTGSGPREEAGEARGSVGGLEAHQGRTREP